VRSKAARQDACRPWNTFRPLCAVRADPTLPNLPMFVDLRIALIADEVIQRRLPRVRVEVARLEQLPPRCQLETSRTSRTDRPFPYVRHRVTLSRCSSTGLLSIGRSHGRRIRALAVTDVLKSDKVKRSAMVWRPLRGRQPCRYALPRGLPNPTKESAGGATCWRAKAACP
jgi:hypothetical protein